MTIVRITVHAVIRTAVLALGLLGYDRVYDQLVPGTPGDADIGKGILAFLLIIAVCGTWGLVDGLRTTPVVWVVAWVTAALAFSIGWEVVTSDGSLEQMSYGSIVFIAQLVLVPALAGAGLTWLLVGRNRPVAETIA